MLNKNVPQNSKGFSNFNILGFLALLPVLGVMTINSCYTGDLSTLMKVGKDTLYRFKITVGYLGVSCYTALVVDLLN